MTPAPFEISGALSIGKLSIVENGHRGATGSSPVSQAPRVLVRRVEPRKADIYQRLGVQVVAPFSWAIHRLADLLAHSELEAVLMVHLIAEELFLGNMTTLLKLSKGELSLVEEKVHPSAVAAGRRVMDLQFPAECILAGVLREGRIIIPPRKHRSAAGG